MMVFFSVPLFILGYISSVYNKHSFENVDHTTAIGKVFTDLDVNPVSRGNTGNALNMSESPDVCRSRRPLAVSTPRQPLLEVHNQEHFASFCSHSSSSASSSAQDYSLYDYNNRHSSLPDDPDTVS